MWLAFMAFGALALAARRGGTRSWPPASRLLPGFGALHRPEARGLGAAPGALRARPRPAAPRRPAGAAPARARPRRAGAARGAAELDRLIHERLRLDRQCTSPSTRRSRSPDLRDLLGASDGNLSVHARKLEDAGYVACEKSFDGRVPRTEYRLTAEGRAALARYLDHMEALIRATRDR
jgi:DNA-binding MarR family transcriptional regulator